MSLISLSTSCVLMCVWLILQSIYNITLLASGRVKVAITGKVCAITQNLRLTSNNVTLFTLFILSMERLISTRTPCFKGSYCHKMIELTVLALSTASWVYAIVFTFYDVLPSRGEQYGSCYCENSLNISLSHLTVYLIVYVIADALAMSTFWLVYKISEKAFGDFGINTASHSLTERFQIWHNIRTIGTLLPNVTVHAVCLFLRVCLLALSVNLYQTHLEALSLTVLQIYYLLTVFHVMAHPLVCIRHNAQLGKIVVNLLRGGCVKLLLKKEEATRVGAAAPAETVSPEGNGTRKKQPIGIRNTVWFKMSPDQHQMLMNTIWDTTKHRKKTTPKTTSKM